MKYYISKLFYFASSDSLAGKIREFLTDAIDVMINSAESNSGMIKLAVDRLFEDLIKVLNKILTLDFVSTDLGLKTSLYVIIGSIMN